jgi:hypothetical protein
VPSPVHPYSDYGVSLRTLRSARSWLSLTVVLCVLAQVLGFALLWSTPQPYDHMKAAWRPTARPASRSISLEDIFRAWRASAEPPATSPAKAATVPAASDDGFFPPDTTQGPTLNVRTQWKATYTLAVPVTQLASLIAVSSQAIIVFITLLVMLVAQAPGVAQIIKSLIWSVLLLFMFLPWQTLARDFPIPGVIYSYSEMLQTIGASVVGDKVSPFETWMIYARFLAWPALSLLALLITAERFRAGVMIAIGHPLQSMMQPRGTAGTVMPAAPLPGKPRPVNPGRPRNP